MECRTNGGLTVRATPLCVYMPVELVAHCQVREERYDNRTAEVDREFDLRGCAVRYMVEVFLVAEARFQV